MFHKPLYRQMKCHSTQHFMWVTFTVNGEAKYRNLLRDSRTHSIRNHWNNEGKNKKWKARLFRILTLAACSCAAERRFFPLSRTSEELTKKKSKMLSRASLHSSKYCRNFQWSSVRFNRFDPVDDRHSQQKVEVKIYFLPSTHRQVRNIWSLCNQCVCTNEKKNERKVAKVTAIIMEKS